MTPEDFAFLERQAHELGAELRVLEWDAEGRPVRVLMVERPVWLRPSRG